MNCAACPITVKKALQAVDSVSLVAVDYKSKVATVGFDDQKTTVDSVQAATGNAGYPSQLIGKRP